MGVGLVRVAMCGCSSRVDQSSALSKSRIRGGNVVWRSGFRVYVDCVFHVLRVTWFICFLLCKGMAFDWYMEVLTLVMIHIHVQRFRN